MVAKRLCIFATVLSFIGAWCLGRADDPADPAVSDAQLNDVHFVDALHGWAVGERGVIWRTKDGGATWLLQDSGTVCSLQSVWFVDENTGWVVGGQGLPYSPFSTGLVLATTDGGHHWRPLSWQQYPRLHRVQFFNAKSGMGRGVRVARLRSV
jgi:photosystem II stability/assembly factor-like uncharacterized protein